MAGHCLRVCWRKRRNPAVSATATDHSGPALYGASYRVYVRIARMVLHEKGVAYRHEPIDIFAPDTVPATYREMHPFNKIPAFVHGDLRLHETQAITRYVDEAFTGPALQPERARDRALMNQVLGIVDAYAYPTLVWDIYVERSKPERGEPMNETRIAAALPRARVCLHTLAKLLAGRDNFGPAGISLADLHLAPVFGYFAKTADAETLLADLPELRRWWSRMQQRASWRTACTD